MSVPHREADISSGNPLRDTAFITSRIRFDAARRLRLLSVYSVTSLTLLSCYLIILNVSQIVFKSYITPLGDDILNTFNIGISIVMIVVSLVEYATAKDTRAQTLESNAHELSRIHGEIGTLCATNSMTADKYATLSERYGETLRRCSANHSDTDYRLYRARNPAHFPKYRANVVFRLFVQWQLLMEVYAFYYVVAIFIPAAGCIAIWLARDTLFRPIS